jgi:predicted adenylyl cyclase CyaB
MASNIEIKARVTDIRALHERAAGLADGPRVELRQEDTFFPTATGRLKLRCIENAGAELIFYQRPDRAGPALSTYRRTAIEDPVGLRASLTEALGVDVTVRKVRWLYRVGRTRIHVDDVEGLGHYMELEVVLREGESVAAGECEAAELAARLGIKEQDRVRQAYADMLRS